jgi:16S rRNA (cytosine967-C5)-methyltransferase
MKYANQYLQSAASIIKQYDGSVPLHHFLKSFFAAEKKYGSKDRRNISHLCYAFYRLGHTLKNIPAAERIAIVLFLTGADEWVDIFPTEWQANLHASFDERVETVKATYPSFNIDSIFPFQQLSASIDHGAFASSHLHQPKLFIRIRKGKDAYVKKQLTAADIPFEEAGEHALAFVNNTKLDTVLKINEDYVVQDINSQAIGELMKISKRPYYMKVWDCCAASGGKSLLAEDILKDIKLTVTDVRSSIINNLKNRLRQAQVKDYTSFVVDVSNTSALSKTLQDEKFDLVICDAPCTGSGTWGRTPEQLYFFTEDKITHYTNLQKEIAANASRYIKAGGYFLYITCSVFKAENEDVVEFIKQQFHLKLVKMELLKGYDKKADTMFAALFTA